MNDQYQTCSHGIPYRYECLDCAGDNDMNRADKNVEQACRLTRERAELQEQYSALAADHSRHDQCIVNLRKERDQAFAEIARLTQDKADLVEALNAVLAGTAWKDIAPNDLAAARALIAKHGKETQ